MELATASRGTLTALASPLPSPRLAAYKGQGDDELGIGWQRGNAGENGFRTSHPPYSSTPLPLPLPDVSQLNYLKSNQIQFKLMKKKYQTDWIRRSRGYKLLDSGSFAV